MRRFAKDLTVAGHVLKVRVEFLNAFGVVHDLIRELSGYFVLVKIPGSRLEDERFGKQNSFEHRYRIAPTFVQ